MNKALLSALSLAVAVAFSVPAVSAANAAAATARVPVHDFDRRRRFGNSAWNVMHRLAWELFPSLAQVYAGSPRPVMDGSDTVGDPCGAVA